MSSDPHNPRHSMLNDLLIELERTRRTRATRHRLTVAAATLLVIGTGALLVMTLSRPTAVSPPMTHHPVDPPSAPSQIARIKTDPAILDRVRIAADTSRIERITTRPMPELRITDAELAALTANTDHPLGVVRIGTEAFIISARWQAPLPASPERERGG